MGVDGRTGQYYTRLGYTCVSWTHMRALNFMLVEQCLYWVGLTLAAPFLLLSWPGLWLIGVAEKRQDKRLAK